MAPEAREPGAMPADLALVRRLVTAENGLAIVSTTRADGTVQSSLVNAGVLDHPVTGEPVVGLVVRADALKLRLMRASGRACVAWRSGWEWVAVEGPVDVAGPDDALAGVADGELPACCAPCSAPPAARTTTGTSTTG